MLQTQTTHRTNKTQRKLQVHRSIVLLACPLGACCFSFVCSSIVFAAVRNCCAQRRNVTRPFVILFNVKAITISPATCPICLCMCSKNSCVFMCASHIQVWALLNLCPSSQLNVDAHAQPCLSSFYEYAHVANAIVDLRVTRYVRNRPCCNDARQYQNIPCGTA